MLKSLALKQRSDYVKTLSDLVRLESPTDDKAANDRLVEHLIPLLRADGWELERVTQDVVGNQLVARFAAPGDTSSLLLCHFDTVWPVGTLAKMPLKEEDGRLYGPGTMDMKAGITTAIHALRLIRDNNLTPLGPVTMLLTSDEEKGSHYSRDLIETLAKEHDRVFVLEPSREDGAVKVGRKGIGDFTVRFTGISAHAGNNPQDGASALRELAQFLLVAEALTDYDQGTTVNVTVARAGSVSNVIAEEATCWLDMRAQKVEEAERVERTLKTYQPKDERVRVEVEGGINRPPMEFTDQNKRLFKVFEAAQARVGITLNSAVVGGGSDGNFTSALNIPTLDGLGSAGEGPHARHEHIRIEDTLERLALLTALLTEAP